jgi:hypothetical protein
VCGARGPHSLSGVPMNSRLSFLKWLLSFGATLPQIWPDVLIALEALQRIFGKIVPAEADEGGLQMVELSSEETACIEQIALEVGGEGAAFDGTRLQRLLDFAAAHPNLIKFLKTFFPVPQ